MVAVIHCHCIKPWGICVTRSFECTTGRSLECSPPCEQDTKSAYNAHYGPMGKWPWRYTSTCQGSSKELDLEWICPVVVGFQHPQNSMSPYHAHGHAHYAHMVNDQVVHLQTKMYRWFQWIWFGVNRLSSCIHKIPRAFIMPMGMPIMPTWPLDHDVAHLQAKTVPMNLIWSVSAQWLLSYNIHKVWAGRTDRQTDGQTDERTEEGTDRRRAFHSPPFFLWKGWETIVKWLLREDLKESKIWIWKKTLVKWLHTSQFIKWARNKILNNYFSLGTTTWHNISYFRKSIVILRKVQVTN